MLYSVNCTKVKMGYLMYIIINSFVFLLSTVMADPMEHATGLEKQELLSKAAGNEVIVPFI